MRTKILISSICVTFVIGAFYLGNYFGEIKGFENSYINVSKKFVRNHKLRNVDFSKTTLDLDNRLIMNRLFTSAKTDSSKEVFSKVLHEVHHEVLNKIYEAVDVPEEVSQQMVLIYDSIHNNLANQYYDVFSKKRAESLASADPHFYRNAYDLGEQFGLTVSEGICDILLNLSTLATLSKSLTLTSVAKGSYGCWLVFICIGVLYFQS